MINFLNICNSFFNYEKINTFSQYFFADIFKIKIKYNTRKSIKTVIKIMSEGLARYFSWMKNISYTTFLITLIAFT